MYVNREDTRIIMYRYNYGTGEMEPVGIFQDGRMLAAYLSKQVSTYGYKDPERWYIPILGEQMVSPDDCFIDRSEVTPHGRTCRAIRRPCQFRDAYGRILDVKGLMPEIIKIHGKEPKGCLWMIQGTKRQSMGKHYHTCVRPAYNKHVRKMREMDALKHEEEPEYKMLAKPKKDICEIRVSRASAGWKQDRKCRKQWQKHLGRQGKLEN